MSRFRLARGATLLVGAALALGVGALDATTARGGESDAKGAAKPPQAPIGFSKLLVRLEGRDEIGIVGADHQVRLIERMRAKGFHAVGAEDLVFGKDESRKAEFLVGGTVKELDCLDVRHVLSCRIGVEWQLFDVAQDAVVYSVLSRAAVLDVPASAKDRYAGMLLTAALDRLLAREGFRKTLGGHDGGSTAKDPTFTPATLAKCAAGRKVTDSAEDLLRVTTIVKTSTGFGSGFLVSPDGLVVTAAHVADSPKLTLRLREGTEVDAVAVRVAPNADVALLRTTKALAGHACAALRVDLPPVGGEVYAAGAPASLDLAFSLTRGIVSGAPEIEGQHRLQTDTPVNPGNSGGPLADVNGQVVGVVSFKLVGGRIEGVGFAVPMAEALHALGLSIGEATDPRLSTEAPTTAKPEAPARLEDDADPVPSLDPEGDARRAAAEERAAAEARRRADRRAREDARDKITPAYVPVLRWGGIGVAVLGVATVVATNSAYSPVTTTRGDFESLRWKNTLGWIGMGLGTGAFVASFILMPPVPASVPVTAHSRLRVGFGAVQWEGTF